MKVLSCASLALMLSTVGSHADTLTTREKVRNELAAAGRTGDVLAPGESGLTPRELHPERYPAAAAAAPKSREEVQSELNAALRSGDLPAMGEVGQPQAAQRDPG
jgi:hypothetical protein